MPKGEKIRNCGKSLNQIFQNIAFLRRGGQGYKICFPNLKASCAAQYVRAAGPATRVAGSNPFELVSALLCKI